MADYPSLRTQLTLRSNKRWYLFFAWVYPAILWFAMVIVAFMAFNHQTLSYFERGESAIKRMVTIPSSTPLR